MSQKQHHKDDDNQTENGMVRGLQNRHVQLIAIAGTIGTGLFLGRSEEHTSELQSQR